MKTFRNLPTGLVLLVASCVFPAGVAAEVASLVHDINPAGEYEPRYVANPGYLAPAGDRLVFTAHDNVQGSELWGSDGTVGGTEILTDVCPGDCNASLSPVATTGKLSFWLVETSLWRSDGSRAGTFALTDGISASDFYGSSWALRGNVLFFSRCDGADCGLWRTDGTLDGTREIKALAANSITAAGNRIFVVSGDEIWRLDPGSETPVLVTRLTSIRYAQGLDDRLLMLRWDGEGDDLWVSDGTAAGTRALTQFPNQDPFGYQPRFLSFGRRTYFVADDIVHGNELWVTDGTPQGTRRITDFGYYFPFSSETLIPTLQEVGTRVVFGARDGLSEEIVDLWSTDGRPESTVKLATPCQTNCGPYEDRPPFRTARAGGVVLFSSRDEEHGVELWSTDGTPAGTRLLGDFCPGACDLLPVFIPATPAGGAVYFSTRQHLWRTDGTAAGTRRLTRQPLEWSDFIRPRIAIAGGKLFIKLGDGDGGSLRILDEGELKPLTFESGRRAGSNPRSLFAHGGTLHFLADDGGGSALWQSAGSPQTTRRHAENVDEVDSFFSAGGIVYSFVDEWELARITDDGFESLAHLSDGSGYVYSSTAGVLGSQVYFAVVREEIPEIWRTDGTVAGTGRFLALPAGRIVGFVTSSGGRIYFGVYDDEADRSELWISDGTVAGTRAIRALPPSQSPSSSFAHVGGVDYFVTHLGFGSDANNRLWRTDGTPEGTRMVSLADRPTRLADGMVAHQGSLYVLGEDYDYPIGTSVLWRVDGEAAVRLRTFARHRDFPRLEIVSAGSLVLFTVDDGTHGVELWATDGTAAGTRLVRDIAPGRLSAQVQDLTVAGGQVFFSAHDLVHGAELWRSDGTSAGTRLVHDIAPGPASSSPGSLTAADGRLYFSADDGLFGRELWALPLAGAGGCQPSPTTLCLQGGRFRVEASWRVEDRFGEGNAVPLTADTGYFWFFEPSNAEVILKVLDGRGLNGHHWVFYGALSNVEYTLTVTDTQTGLTQRYLNPSGQLASVGDTTGFGPQGAFVPRRDPLVALPSPAALVSARTEPAAATGSCQPGPRRLCVNGGRFAVEASWKDFQGKTGQGTAVPLTADTGYFWFFDPANVEVMLKVLDGTALNGRFWVFYGALSNVEYELTVTDTQTGAVKQYRNPSGQFASVADTGAF